MSKSKSQGYKGVQTQTLDKEDSQPPQKKDFKIVGHARVSKSGNALSLKIETGLSPRFFVISKKGLYDLFAGNESVLQIREYDGINKGGNENGSETTKTHQ